MSERMMFLGRNEAYQYLKNGDFLLYKNPSGRWPKSKKRRIRRKWLKRYGVVEITVRTGVQYF